MEKILIKGGKPLIGSVNVSGMKNAAVAVLFASVLTGNKCIIENVPNISDVTCALEILTSMGASVKALKKNVIEIDSTYFRGGTAPFDLVGQMRASYYLYGAELGRFGRTHTPLPGGCDFGVRPIDQHIKGFEALGAKIEIEGGYFDGMTEDGPVAGNVYFDVITVGATINVMLASVLAKEGTTRTTVIENAAKEPHVVDVANFLNTCGAKISGAGTDTIKIKGVDSLHGCTYAIIPDMIEAGTYMIAAAATNGRLRINNVIPKHLESITAKLREMGVRVLEDDESVKVEGTGRLNKINVKTLPYPGFPTDLQPQMCALLCVAKGTSVLNESIWNNRFRYTEELKKMGAKIKVDGNIALIEGGTPMTGAIVKATDLRAGAALIIAGLSTFGTTIIEGVNFIERGYDDVVGKIAGCGGDIKTVFLPDDILKSKAN